MRLIVLLLTALPIFMWRQSPNATSNTSTTTPKTKDLLGVDFTEGVGLNQPIDYVPDARERSKWGVDLNPNNTIYKQQIATRKRQYYEGIAAYIGIGVAVVLLLLLLIRVTKASL